MKNLISKNIENFYNKASEEDRLNSGMGIFEFERIKNLIEKYISKPNSVIVDVGGGTGKYSEWLSKKGHQVYMIEPVKKHIRKAQSRANKLKNPFKIILGEARNLNIKSHSVDLVILHGPLYHLQEKEDRLNVIKEAKRILKKDGVILGFAINYTASTMVGLLQGLLHEQSFFEMCQEELSTGIHNPPVNLPWLLAEAYYHRPEEIKEEFLSQKLEYINTYAVEGITWLDKDYFLNMTHPKKSKTLRKLLDLTENDNNMFALSPHIMIAVKNKPYE